MTYQEMNLQLKLQRQATFLFDWFKPDQIHQQLSKEEDAIYWLLEDTRFSKDASFEECWAIIFLQRMAWYQDDHSNYMFAVENCEGFCNLPDHIEEDDPEWKEHYQRMVEGENPIVTDKEFELLKKNVYEGSFCPVTEERQKIMDINDEWSQDQRNILFTLIEFLRSEQLIQEDSFTLTKEQLVHYGMIYSKLMNIKQSKELP